MNYVADKLMKVTGIICKIRNYVNVRLLKGIYYALAFPYITYGNLVWGITYPSRLIEQNLKNTEKDSTFIDFLKLYRFN